MIGQQSLFKPTGKKLKQRLTLEWAHVSQIRHILRNNHYLGRERSGRQINYVVLIDGVVDGVITYAYPFMSASVCGYESDEILEFARLYLHSNIPHSASCAIGKSLKIIKQDWQQRFPDAKPIKMVISWSDQTRHKGTIYKAANFEWLKVSKAAKHGNNENSKRGYRKSHSDYNHDKDCWIYKL